MCPLMSSRSIFYMPAKERCLYSLDLIHEVKYNLYPTKKKKKPDDVRHGQAKTHRTLNEY